MQRQFFSLCTALGVVGVAGTAMAGDTTRIDVSFAAVDIIPFTFSGAQDIDTADPGRYIDARGWSNVDVDVCWNTGAAESYVASDMQFAMTLDDGSGVGGYFVGGPFAADDTGSTVEGTCVNRQALAEEEVAFPAFFYAVGPDGIVTCGLAAAFDDGLELPAGVCNTADFFFVLTAPAPAGCQGATGSCGEANGTPGCEDVGCCSLVCDVDSGGDPFCCDSSWDSTCVELAIAVCNIFQYSCDAPVYANDCATSPETIGNGDSVEFSTVGANTDGPALPCAGGGGADIWYLINIEGGDQVLTASTCNQVDYDSAIGLYDAGPIGSTFDVATLPDAIVGCNDDCADDDPDAGLFTSELTALISGGNQYLLRVTGYTNPETGENSTGSGTLTVSWVPPIPAQTCDAPGPDSFTQDVTGDLLNGGVACAGGGITTENAYCRVYSAAEVGGDFFNIDCVEFGVSNSGSYIEGRINVLTSLSGSPSPYADMTLVGSKAFGFYSTGDLNEYFIVSFEGEGGLDVDLSDGSSLVIEMEYGPSSDGFATFGGGTGVDVSAGTTYLRSASCGLAEYLAVGDINFDLEWLLNVSGTIGGSTPCPADFNGDGVVDGADFGSILAAWGPCPAPCPEDLNGDGVVNGADVGGLLAAWGPCP